MTSSRSLKQELALYAEYKRLPKAIERARARGAEDAADGHYRPPNLPALAYNYDEMYFKTRNLIKDGILQD